MNGTTLIFIGILMLIAGGGLYLWRHPEVLGLAQKRISAAKKVVNEVKEVETMPVRTGYAARPLTFRERLTELPAGTMFKVKMPDGYTKENLQLSERFELLEHRQYRVTGSEWRKSGTRWQGLKCFGNAIDFPGEVVIIDFGGDAYLFSERHVLDPDESSNFQQYGQRYVQEGKISGRTEIPYDGKFYGIEDIGVYSFEHSEQGRQEVLARFIRGHNSDGEAILIEDTQYGTDTVWTGWRVDLSRDFTDILTPDGS